MGLILTALWQLAAAVPVIISSPPESASQENATTAATFDSFWDPGWDSGADVDGANHNARTDILTLYRTIGGESLYALIRQYRALLNAALDSLKGHRANHLRYLRFKHWSEEIDVVRAGRDIDFATSGMRATSDSR